MTTVEFTAVDGADWFRMYARHSAGGQGFSVSVEDIDRMVQQLQAIRESNDAEIDAKLFDQGARDLAENGSIPIEEAKAND